MTRLEELSQRYHTHPDEGGDYLSLNELNELCHLQNCEIKQLHHKVAVKHRRAFRAERAEQDSKREIEHLRNVIDNAIQCFGDEEGESAEACIADMREAAASSETLAHE